MTCGKFQISNCKIELKFYQTRLGIRGSSAGTPAQRASSEAVGAPPSCREPPPAPRDCPAPVRPHQWALCALTARRDYEMERQLHDFEEANRNLRGMIKVTPPPSTCPIAVPGHTPPITRGLSPAS